MFFRTLGLDARSNEVIRGARTTHAVDVTVRMEYGGFQILWIVECKYWRDRVSKLHVMALREIVSDIGADRGIILCETGFQSGAIEASRLTNVHTTSLATLRETARADVWSMRLRELFDRVEACKARYWELDKERRIEMGLRPDVGAAGFSGAQVVEMAIPVLAKALRGSYPIEYDPLRSVVLLGRQFTASAPEEVAASLEPLVAEFERRLGKLR